MSVDYKLPTGEHLYDNAEYEMKKMLGELKSAFESMGIKAEYRGMGNRGVRFTRFDFHSEDTLAAEALTLQRDGLIKMLSFQDAIISEENVGSGDFEVFVSNLRPRTVKLWDFIDRENEDAPGMSLPIPLGFSPNMKKMYLDLEKEKNIFMCGSRGYGMSVQLNSVITSMLMKFRPRDLKLILVGNAHYDLKSYRRAPHLLAPLTDETENSVAWTYGSLEWCVLEINRRLEMFAEGGYDGFSDYNEKNRESRLPRIMLVLTEIQYLWTERADLLLSMLKFISDLGRGAGFYSVITCGYPNSDEFVELFKKEFSAKLIFKMINEDDSVRLLGSEDACKLLGIGDLLYIEGDIIEPKRIQCPFHSDGEVMNLMDYLELMTEDIPKRNYQQRMIRALSNKYRR